MNKQIFQLVQYTFNLAKIHIFPELTKFGTKLLRKENHQTTQWLLISYVIWYKVNKINQGYLFCIE